MVKEIQLQEPQPDEEKNSSKLAKFGQAFNTKQLRQKEGMYLNDYKYFIIIICFKQKNGKKTD